MTSPFGIAQFRFFIIIYFFLILKDAGSLVTIEEAYGISFLCTIHFISTVAQYICHTMDDTFCVGDTGDLVFVISKIEVGSISKSP